MTHWGRVSHMCVGNLTTIGSDNGSSPDGRQANICTNAGILLIWPEGTKFSEILIDILTISFKEMRLKVSSAKWWPICLGLNVLTELNGYKITDRHWYGCFNIKNIFYPVMGGCSPCYGQPASPWYCLAISRACFNWTSLWILKLEVVPKNIPWHLPFAMRAAAEGTFEISFDNSLDWKDWPCKWKRLCGMVV